MPINVAIQPFWPTNRPKPSADSWRNLKQTFLDYKDLLPTVNNTVPLIKVQKLKLLRLYLGDLGQSYFDSRRLNEEPTLEDALRQLTKLCGPKITSSQPVTVSSRWGNNPTLNRLRQAVQLCDYKSILSSGGEKVTTLDLKHAYI